MIDNKDYQRRLTRSVRTRKDPSLYLHGACRPALRADHIVGGNCHNRYREEFHFYRGEVF